MSKSTDIATKMSPEGLEIANAYLELGSTQAVCIRLNIDENKVQEYLGKREIKQYKIKASDIKITVEKVLGVEILTENIKF